jgi:hypothetical protein
MTIEEEKTIKRAIVNYIWHLQPSEAFLMGRDIENKTGLKIIKRR